MNHIEFRDRLTELPRDEILEIIEQQDPKIRKQVRRIEWVFEHKLSHLYWEDGTPIEGRKFTNYELALMVDVPFMEDPDLTKMKVSIEQQRELHIARDPVLWAKHYLKVEPRAYQVLMLRHPNTRKVLRAGRRLGKTYTMAILLLHYSYTHNDGRCIVVAPMKSHVELIYQEMTRLAARSDIVSNSITRKVTSPQFMIEMSNGSTIRFFTSGIRSGGKADVVRGQEAHIIVLDELDYMHTDDLDSLYAMLQKTDENQDSKILVGASTPTGRREKFWDWCHSKRFTEFWFPSYCNPNFTKEDEEEFREQYGEMAFRHEIEADWGEDAEGVYPRRFVDLAFASGAVHLTDEERLNGDVALNEERSDWNYLCGRISAHSFFVIGVDWDKYGAGCNIVVLEVCNSKHEDPRFNGRIRLAYREEVRKDEYTLISAVDRVIELNEIFNPEHIYVDRGYGECVAPDTLISTITGVKEIQDIEIGDRVLSQDGLFHPVTGKIVREDNKPTYQVKVAKNIPVKVSNTHPFLTLEGIWKNVSELKLGDYVAVPKLQKQDYSSIIDIMDYIIPDGFDEDFVWAENINGQNPVKVNRYYDIYSPEFLKFAGWYLSEGSISQYTLEIAQNSEDVDNVQEIIKCVREVSNIDPQILCRIDDRKQTYKNMTRTIISSKPFAQFIEILLGKGSDNKKIPEMLYCQPYLLGDLVNTLFKGDGHQYKTGTNFGYEISLSSFGLIDQLRQVLLSVGIPTSVYKVKRPQKDLLKLVVSGDQSLIDRFVQFTNLDIPNPDRINRRSFKEDESFMYFPIRSIEYLGEVSGLVDIEVEGGESFVGNGILLHNTQVELLHKHGVDHPQTNLKKKVKGVAFGGSIEVRDPFTKQPEKKEMKPFMVDNFRQMLEKTNIVFPAHDEELYIQLISYVVIRKTALGRPVFEAAGSASDHIHDALILACLAITENYGDLMKLRYATRSKSISNEVFLEAMDINSRDKEKAELVQERMEAVHGVGVKPGIPRRSMTVNMGRSRRGAPIQRKKF